MNESCENKFHFLEQEALVEKYFAHVKNIFVYRIIQNIPRTSRIARIVIDEFEAHLTRNGVKFLDGKKDGDRRYNKIHDEKNHEVHFCVFSGWRAFAFWARRVEFTRSVGYKAGNTECSQNG